MGPGAQQGHRRRGWGVTGVPSQEPWLLRGVNTCVHVSVCLSVGDGSCPSPRRPLRQGLHAPQEGSNFLPGLQNRAGPKSPKSLLTTRLSWGGGGKRGRGACSVTVALGGHPKGTGKKPLGSSSILLPGKADCPHPAEPAPESPECEVTPTASPSPCAPARRPHAA